MLLLEAGLDPRNVRLLRHQQIGRLGQTPYTLWRDNAAELESYQSAQPADRRAYFASDCWAGFVVPPDGSTLFVGLYRIFDHRPAGADWIDPLSRLTPPEMQRELDIYGFERLLDFDHLIGRLKIDWGSGTRSWVQRADKPNGNKQIVELAQSFREPDFPSYTAFISNFAVLPNIPPTWIAALSAARGIYLLTCPRTREQYVGAAYGNSGFWGRWQAYIASGHGGNEGLKSRDPSDYQISILEAAGSAATVEDIVAMEVQWKLKLQSREMGLNRN